MKESSKILDSKLILNEEEEDDYTPEKHQLMAPKTPHLNCAPTEGAGAAVDTNREAEPGQAQATGESGFSAMLLPP